jgi:MFS family permease
MKPGLGPNSSLGLTLLALFVVSLGYGVVVPQLPALTGFSGTAGASALAWAHGSYAGFKILAQLPAGAWVDRWGSVRVLRVALLAFTLSVSGFLVAGPVPWFAFLRAVEGAATGVVYPAAFALALLSTGGNPSGKRLGVVMAVGSSGLLLGPALAAALASRGARTPVLVGAVLAAAATSWAWSTSRRSPAPPGGSSLTDLKALLRRLREPAFVGALLPIGFNKLSYTGLAAVLPLFGPDRLGLSGRGVGLLFVLTGLCFGLAQVLGGALSDRFRPRSLILACTPFLVGGLAGMAAASVSGFFAAGTAVYVLASSVIFNASLKHLAQAHGTEATYGGVYGLLGTVTDVMTVVGPVVFLALYARSPASVFWAMAALGSLFSLAFALLAPTRPT